jgi:hypothetical protein
MRREEEMAMPGTDADVIDTLVGIKPGSALGAIRNRRPEARKEAQASYRALFVPETLGGVGTTERFAVAAFITGLHGEAETAALRAAGAASRSASSLSQPNLSQAGAPFSCRSDPAAPACLWERPSLKLKPEAGRSLALLGTGLNKRAAEVCNVD